MATPPAPWHLMHPQHLWHHGHPELPIILIRVDIFCIPVPSHCHQPAACTSSSPMSTFHFSAWFGGPYKDITHIGNCQSRTDTPSVCVLCQRSRDLFMPGRAPIQAPCVVCAKDVTICAWWIRARRPGY